MTKDKKQQTKLKELTGKSQKQIKYATNVRDYVLFQLDNMEDQEQAKKVKKVVLRTSKAHIILKYFAESFKEKKVIINLEKAIFFCELKDKKTFNQKDLHMLTKLHLLDQLLGSLDKYDLNKDYFQKDFKPKFNNSNSVPDKKPNLSEKDKKIIEIHKTINRYFEYLNDDIKNKSYYSEKFEKIIEDNIKWLEVVDPDDPQEFIKSSKQKLSALYFYKYYLKAKKFLNYEEQDIEKEDWSNGNSAYAAALIAIRGLNTHIKYTDDDELGNRSNEVKAKFSEKLRNLNKKFTRLNKDLKSLEKGFMKDGTILVERIAKAIYKNNPDKHYQVGDLIFTEPNEYVYTHLFKDAFHSPKVLKVVKIKLKEIREYWDASDIYSNLVWKIDNDGDEPGNWKPISGLYYYIYAEDVSNTAEGKAYLNKMLQTSDYHEKVRYEQKDKYESKLLDKMDRKRKKIGKKEVMLINKLFKNKKFLDYNNVDTSIKEDFESEKYSWLGGLGNYCNEYYDEFRKVRMSSKTKRLYEYILGAPDGLTLRFVDLSDQEFNFLNKVDEIVNDFDSNTTIDQLEFAMRIVNHAMKRRNVQFPTEGRLREHSNFFEDPSYKQILFLPQNRTETEKKVAIDLYQFGENTYDVKASVSNKWLIIGTAYKEKTFENEWCFRPTYSIKKNRIIYQPNYDELNVFKMHNLKNINSVERYIKDYLLGQIFADGKSMQLSLNL